MKKARALSIVACILLLLIVLVACGNNTKYKCDNGNTLQLSVNSDDTITATVSVKGGESYSSLLYDDFLVSFNADFGGIMYGLIVYDTDTIEIMSYFGNDDYGIDGVYKK